MVQIYLSMNGEKKLCYKIVNKPWNKDFRADLTLKEAAPGLGLCFYIHTDLWQTREDVDYIFSGQTEQLYGRKFALLHPLFPGLKKGEKMQAKQLFTDT